MDEQEQGQSKLSTICAIGIVILVMATFALYQNQGAQEEQLNRVKSELEESRLDIQSLEKDFWELALALKVKKIGGWWYKDTNGDGKYDKAWQDNDGDVWGDEEWVDTDHDGKWDKMNKDTDNDAKDKPDEGKKDTDGDGKFDKKWKDSNGDGKEDAGEWSELDPEDMDDDESPPTAPEDL